MTINEDAPEAVKEYEDTRRQKYRNELEQQLREKIHQDKTEKDLRKQLRKKRKEKKLMVSRRVFTSDSLIPSKIPIHRVDPTSESEKSTESEEEYQELAKHIFSTSVHRRFILS